MSRLDKVIVAITIASALFAGMQIEKLNHPKEIIKNQSAQRIVVYSGYGYVELRPGKRYMMSFKELEE